MPQFHFYVPEEVAERLRERAHARGETLSGYVATVIRRDLADEWPQGFFDDVVGAWVGEPLSRPPQGEYEERADQ